ncbi:hypothetical protein TNCV_3585842 [Trichonephila clavipes]|nr:hypothetical protein TNCV_3585842 [Trichonephila clavipes]
MKIQHISREQRREDAALLEKASKPSVVMGWMDMSSKGLTKPFFCVEPKAKIDATYYQQKFLKYMIKEIPCLNCGGGDKWCRHLSSLRGISPTNSYCHLYGDQGQRYF